jgi:hypothetical protein
MNQNTASQGMAFASHLMALATLSALFKKGFLTHQEVAEVFSSSNAHLQKWKDAFPGDPEAMSFAQQTLKMAEMAILAVSAQKPPSGSN